MLYQVLLGQEKGPRFGSFVAVDEPPPPAPVTITTCPVRSVI